jgi:hypothetical protein
MTFTADQTILDLNNPSTQPARVDISASTVKQRVTLSAQSEGEMVLGPTARSGGVVVRSTVPILVERITVHKGKTDASNGSPR